MCDVLPAMQLCWRRTVWFWTMHYWVHCRWGQDMPVSVGRSDCFIFVRYPWCFLFIPTYVRVVYECNASSIFSIWPICPCLLSLNLNFSIENCCHFSSSNYSAFIMESAICIFFLLHRGLRVVCDSILCQFKYNYAWSQFQVTVIVKSFNVFIATEAFRWLIIIVLIISLLHVYRCWKTTTSYR